MKFQNPSFNFFFERTDEQTDGRTSRKQYAPHFFKVGGIITRVFSGCKPIKGSQDSLKAFLCHSSLRL